ncbi:YceI family protein [Limnovirga soli]|uniref:YceI family protein n=1 Tax=Limnovirga soli TaxID=2656915 RepID=A0A8J8FIU5_9BACT|nr:YceI family protein [Limnovirga soli]NNV55869.1 YceI family protein [Limnovirga soli]
MAFKPDEYLFGGVNKKNATIWAVQKTSSLRINGASNVNKFGCEITQYYSPDTIFCSEENSVNKSVTLSGNMKIGIDNFDCHNHIITNDLRKTLKSSDYPYLIIHFLSLERKPNIANGKDSLKGCVDIQLGGITHRFELNYTFEKISQATFKLNGNRDFTFSDFKLEPPKKLGGIIKVKDSFTVDFSLTLIKVNQ